MNRNSLQQVMARLLAGVMIFSLLMTGLTTLPVGAAAGTIINVTTTVDSISTDGYCSLREAVIAANKNVASSPKAGECKAGTGDDIIYLPPGTYSLTRTDNGKEDSASTGDLDIQASVTVAKDPSAAENSYVIINGVNFSDRIFQSFAGNVKIADLTIRGGKNALGGGIYNAGSTLTLVNVTITANTATTQGGGMYQSKGTANLNNVTIAYNTATGTRSAGGGGGVYAAGGAFNLGNTIISDNTDLSGKNPNYYGITLPSQGYNLFANAKLVPLTPNNDGFATLVLSSTSPAIDAGSPAAPSETLWACALKDMRGAARPQGNACDIGAYEYKPAGPPPQPGPKFVVNSPDDTADACTDSKCTLRSAILAANARPNDSATAPDQIAFAIPNANPPVIQPASALPEIKDPVSIDGTTQLIIDGQQVGKVVLDGSLITAPGVDGLTITAGNTTVIGLEIRNFSGNGIELASSGNQIQKNFLLDNTLAGAAVVSGTGNTIRNTSTSGNKALGIDLGGDGPTLELPGSLNYPVLIGAEPIGSQTRITGRLNGAPNGVYTLDFYTNTSCDISGFGQGAVYLTSQTITLEGNGNQYFFKNPIDVVLDPGLFVTVTATKMEMVNGSPTKFGSTSEFSRCLVSGPRNDAWTSAIELPDGWQYTANQYLDRMGQSRWYKFPILPNSKVIVTLTNLLENYDLTLYKDISQAFNTAQNPADLAQLGAEFAPDAFSPDAFSPDAFSPDAFSPDAFSPDAFSPDAFSPDAFSPDAFSPDAFSPDAFSPDAFSPDAFSPDAFSSAQTMSLVGVSAFEGTASEGIAANTWQNTGYYYVRIRGRNGAYSLDLPFTLQVWVIPGECSTLSAGSFRASNTPVVEDNYKTIILTDSSRTAGSAAEKLALENTLDQFVQRLNQNGAKGVLVDVANDNRVIDANTQADGKLSCPNAKNLVAYAVKDIVDQYAKVNPLEYVVILGDDSVIPFFRLPDHSNLANESNYHPPVKDGSASQASLRLGYVLGQDRYGSTIELSSKVNSIPLPDKAVGRLVSTIPEIINMLNAYLATSSGVVSSPTSTLVTGYDFLADSSAAIADNLDAGTGLAGERLIDPSDLAPDLGWDAADLSNSLLGSSHGLIYLAGHFSASSALAADYKTRLLASEVAAASTNFTNSIVFSAGCHSGYSIVPGDAILNVTATTDWARAFASKGATLIAGTGYQYGDTDFIKYSERIYEEFSKQLITGTPGVAVSIGKALVNAKVNYMATEPILRGVSEKAVIESTLFGLPMLSVDLPNRPGGTGVKEPVVTALSGYTTNPGLELGLGYADYTLSPTLNRVDVPVSDVTNPDPETNTFLASYLTGGDGVVSNPEEIILPLEIRNASVPGKALRGIGFRGGSYHELENFFALTGAPATEIRGVHTYFQTDVFYPILPWRINYYDVLRTNGSGVTSAMFIPAQYKSAETTAAAGVLRAYDAMNFRLFYSGYTQPEGSTAYNAALSAVPSIVQVVSTIQNGVINFNVYMTGDPAAGIQEVWVTYTVNGLLVNGQGTWTPVDLHRSPSSAVLWTGSLPLPVGVIDPKKINYLVQAVNGVGLVALDTNQGEYFVPGENTIIHIPGQSAPTYLTLSASAPSGAYSTKATFTARLTTQPQPCTGCALAGQYVYFELWPQTSRALTDSSGAATVTMPLAVIPGNHKVTAAFRGTQEYMDSAAEIPFTVTKQLTQITLEANPINAQFSDPVGFVATLEDITGKPLAYKALFFVMTDGTNTIAEKVDTDYAGRAYLNPVLLQAGTYQVNVYFSGTVPLPGDTLHLEDYSYEPSTATLALNVAQETASLNYTGPTRIASGTPLNLTSEVSQDPDGSLGNLALAQVKYDLFDAYGTQVFSGTAAVDSQGAAAPITVPDLASGIYLLNAQVTGGYFTSPVYTYTIVVYNPNGRQVNGNAQIYADPGSFPANQTQASQVSFAFVVSYGSKDAAVPDGNMHFNFQDVNWVLRATSFDWLVFMGNRAEYSGYATLNDAGSCWFFVSIIDSDYSGSTQQSDFLRIQVREGSPTGTILFDNQPGAAITAPPVTPSINGNITIHD